MQIAANRLGWVCQKLREEEGGTVQTNLTGTAMLSVMKFFLLQSSIQCFDCGTHIKYDDLTHRMCTPSSSCKNERTHPKRIRVLYSAVWISWPVSTVVAGEKMRKNVYKVPATFLSIIFSGSSPANHLQLAPPTHYPKAKNHPLDIPQIPSRL
jgi:hypothetical protein